MLYRIAAACAFAASLAPADIVNYEIRPTEGARLALLVEKTGFLSGKKHLFLFGRYHGRIAHDPNAPEQSQVEMRVESASLSCKDTWVSEKDRRKIERVALDDMLVASKYPQLVFTSERIVRTPAGFEVHGTLTLRGVSKPAFTTIGVTEKDGRITRVAGSATLRMKDFGMKPPAAALGLVGTRNEMTVEFDLVPAPVVNMTQQ